MVETHRDETKSTVAKMVLVYLPFFLIYILLFTEIGMGATFFKALSGGADWAYSVAVIGFGIWIILYLFDISLWTNKGFKGVLRAALILIVLAATIVSVALTFTVRPYAPILSYIVGLAVIYTIVYRTHYKRKNFSDFLEALGITFILWGIAGFITAVGWASISNFWWGVATQEEFRDRIRVCEDMSTSDDGSTWCEEYGRCGVRCRRGCPEVEGENACSNDEDELTCLAALLLWANPFVFSIVAFVFGASMHYIAAADPHGRQKSTRQNAR
eukprot:1477381-Rhodomonas_salina.1